MNNQAKILIGALTALSLVLAIGLAVSLATDDDESMDNMPGMGTAGGNSYMGMMQAMGSMQSDALLEHMREVLDEDGYEAMLEHMREHRSGAVMPGGSSIDDRMHRMMDGMMQQMPDDSGGNMPMRPR